jgi:HSP20 family molecular chaperone IbpA
MNATVDETLERVEQLYTAITGTRPPMTNEHRAAFPPELDPVVHVEHQLERMVAAVESVVPVPSPWRPRATMWREDEDIMISIDVPGVSRDNVRVQVEQGSIVVIGRRHATWGRNPRKGAEGDTPVGTFARSFPLSAALAPEQLTARLESGVLLIRVRGGARQRPSQVSVTT